MSLPPFLSEAPLPLLPLRHGVVLPGAVTSLPVGRPKSRALAEAMSAGDHLVLSVQRDPNLIDPELRDMHGIGVLVRRRGVEAIRLESFFYGWLLAFALSLVRFLAAG